MQQSNSFSPEAVLRGYFHAKDENRPHLLEDVFASNAELLIHNLSANIAFPAFTQGRSAIAEVLVRSFSLSNENVYSFYLGRPPPNVRLFKCPWLVGMSERSSGHVRVGCGTYEWAFEPHAPHMASRLVVTIEAMQVLPIAESAVVFAWLRALNYPWSSAEDALQGIPGTSFCLPSLNFSAAMSPSPNPPSPMSNDDQTNRLLQLWSASSSGHSRSDSRFGLPLPGLSAQNGKRVWRTGQVRFQRCYDYRPKQGVCSRGR